MKITKAQLKQIIKEELKGTLNEVTDSEKWSTITMGARVQFPEWEMFSGGGRMKRLAKALEDPTNRQGKTIRQEFEETYSAIKDIERADTRDVYKKGKSITMSFLEKLRGAI